MLIRYNKPEDLVTTFTHMLLCVKVEGAEFLVDVGFGGIGSLVPLRLDTEEPQVVFFALEQP
jgi:N-hydroxyarylamine O-acetyltransferase